MDNNYSNNANMNLNIKATGLDLTPAIKEYAQKKMDKLEKYLGNFKVMSAKLEMEKTTRHHVKGEIFRAEANLVVNGDLLRVEKTEKDIFKAIDKVKDHMELMIRKYKDKILDRKKNKEKISKINI